MSTRTLLAIAAVPALVLYQQHLRLSSTFPSLGIPPLLEISGRTDKPAIGMDRLSGEIWRGCHAGDAWSVVVPRRLLEGHGGRAAANAEAGDDLALAWARAWWSSWPLQLEKNIVGFLARHQLRPFALRKAKDGCTEGERRDFAPGAQVLGGLFIVEAHDEPARSSQDESSSQKLDEPSPPLLFGPIIASWWIKPLKPSTSTTPEAIGLLGGYHSFSAEEAPPSAANQEPLVRLTFTSHLILDSPLHPNHAARPSPPTSDLQGLSAKQRLLMAFHVLYSRVLMDCAVRRVKAGRFE